MNSRYLSKTGFIFISLMVMVSASLAFAQADQYKRPSKKKEVTAPVVTGSDTKSTDGKVSTDGKASEGNAENKKVDISDLEQRYWAPKDVEFSVVQNRTYSKEKRFAGSVQYGMLINDGYSSGTAISTSLSYYFSERYGAELNFTKYSLTDNDTTQFFYSRYGAIPDHNVVTNYYGASFNWVPVYAKLSLLEKQIIYFDFSISPGIGIMKYQPQVNPNGGLTAPEKSAIAFSIDAAQHFFLNKNFALRVDFKTRMFNEEVSGWGNNLPVRTKTTYQNLLLFGFTYYN